jgi:hypothetical protein
MSLIDWTVIGCAVLLVGVAMFSGWLGGHCRRGTVAAVPLVLVRARAPLAEERMRAIVKSWAVTDERWQVLEDLLLHYQESALVQAATAKPKEQAQALGAVLALHQLHAALLELREQPVATRTEKRRAA